MFYFWPKHPPPWLGELMFAGYYIWDTKAMPSDIHSHNPSYSQYIVETTRAMTVQALAVDKPTRADEEGEPVSLKNFYVETYTQNLIIVLLGQLVSGMHPLRAIEHQRQGQYHPSFRSRGYNWAWKMMSVVLQAVRNLADTNDAGMVHRTGLLPTMRKVYVLAAMEGWHRRFRVLQRFDESDQSKTWERLTVWFVIRRYKKRLTSGEVIKLSQVANFG